MLTEKSKVVPRVTPRTMPAWTRPIRIPETIEITHTESSFAIAGEQSTWRIPFRLSKDVPPGSVLKFELYGGRNNKGVFPDAQTAKPGSDGYLTAQLDCGIPLSILPDEKEGTYVLSLSAGGLKKGQELAIVIGDRTRGGKGIKVCRDRMLNKFFVLYCSPRQEPNRKIPAWAGSDVWAKGTDERMVAACTMHILGGAIDHIRAYVPATTRPQEPFTVIVRPEDKFGNLSHEEPGPIAVSANGNLAGAKFEKVPESTCLRVTAALSAEGVYRLRVCDTRSGLEGLANPTICSLTAQPVYWGMIHGHTEFSDGTGKIDQYFHQLKNEVMLDFAAPGDHDHLWETSDEFWKATCEAVKCWHTPHEFVTFLGYEWAKWRRNGDGDRNVYYLDDDRPLYRSDDGEYPFPPDLFQVLRANTEKAIIIPHHTGHGGNFCDWKDHSPEHERLVEIFQVRGSYECSEQDGNPVPKKATEPGCYPDGYVRRALALGWRVGFTAGGDDHIGHWGTETRLGCYKTGYKQGLMSVEANERTREAIFDAMYNRRVVATTGARMLLACNLNGNPIGSVLSLKNNPGLASSRKISVEVHGTAAVDRIDVIRNNSVVHSVSGSGEMDLSMAWKDTTPLNRIWLSNAPFCTHPFAFYYVRVIQADGEVAWASPIWLDP